MQAIEEQQARVWRLRNLVECVRNASDSSEDIEDFSAAINGLQDYAEDIHMTLDAGTIVERAQAIEKEEQETATRAAVGAGGNSDVEIATRP